MPRLSLYREKKSNDYRFFDRIIKEQFTVGGTDLYVHKYMGVKDQGPSVDLTQPQRSILDPTQIQDLLFLENRDRNYAPDIYRLRGHYNVQNLDFDLSQFGLFLNNDTIFITIHYNEMIDLIGRKLMVGDVLELPHLTDYHPLNELIPTSLRRYYQVTDGNFASEGFSSTWYAHLWRIKCEPLVDSQEFSSILEQPLNKDNYLGIWDRTKTYVPGYVVTYGDKNYVASSNVPIGTPCTIYDEVTKTYIINSPFWTLDTADNLKDILSRYNTNIAINNAALNEAKRLLPKSGYDNSNLYVVSTDINDEPVSASSIVNLLGAPVRPEGTIEEIIARGQNYFVVRIGAGALKSIWDMTADSDDTKLAEFVRMNLKVARTKPERTDSGSGKVKGDLVLSVKALGAVDGPYGTVDNTYSNADQDPLMDGFTGTIIPDIMDYRADSDPRFHFVARSSPRSFGYTAGYMAGDGSAPNGVTTGAGISFPSQPKLGDYFLRTDYLPQLLFRWDGGLWVKISENVRTGVGFGDANNQSRLSSFINNTNTTTLTDGTTMPERQSLSQILKIQTD
jgi:hypothetical protein